MKLTTDDVLHIAKLSRLELTNAETERYTEELSAILSFVETLQEVDTTGVLPTSHITETLDELRADSVVQISDIERAQLIAQFPASKADLLTVSQVFSSYKE